MDIVEKFDAGDRDAALEDLDGGFDGGGDVAKRANGGGDGVWMRMQTNRGAGDDAERTLRTHKERCQIVAGGGFLWMTARAWGNRQT